MEPQQTQNPKPQAPAKTDYDKELSVGTYAGKKIYETVIGLGTMVAGMYAGLATVGKIIKPPAHVLEEAGMRMPGFLGKLPGLKGRLTGSQLGWGMGVGGFIGSLAGGLFLGYEHWQKVKREQLQVDEITKDISDIEVFKKTDPELAAENKRLWAELQKRDAQPAAMSHAEKHAPAHARPEHGDVKHAEKHEKKTADLHAKKDDRADSWEEVVHASKQAEHHQEAAR